MFYLRTFYSVTHSFVSREDGVTRCEEVELF